MTIQDRQQAINNYLNVHGRALFEDLLDNDSHPIVAAVTFMAMLEMIKTDDIVFRQSELFGPIWIYRKKNNPEFADEMAHETVFFSKDPDVKPGLVEAIRNQAIARSKEQSVGDLAAVMREAVLWTSRGRNVSEDDLNAMLEGREDLSEVQENPFAEMMKEDDGTEVPAAEGAAPAEGTAPATENAPAEESIASIEDAVPVVEESPVEDIPVVDETPVEENDEWIATPSARDDVTEEIPTEEPQPSDNMTDEEFEAFMKKAQAFYDTQANENSDSDDDDFPSIEVHTND